jgi:hypothetical protein
MSSAASEVMRLSISFGNLATCDDEAVRPSVLKVADAHSAVENRVDFALQTLLPHPTSGLECDIAAPCQLRHVSSALESTFYQRPRRIHTRSHGLSYSSTSSSSCASLAEMAHVSTSDQSTCNPENLAALSQQQLAGEH